MSKFATWTCGYTSPTYTDSPTAKADPKDPNADLNTLLGITDK
jgi:hypothetical protein